MTGLTATIKYHDYLPSYQHACKSQILNGNKLQAMKCCKYCPVDDR